MNNFYKNLSYIFIIISIILYSFIFIIYYSFLYFHFFIFIFIMKRLNFIENSINIKFTLLKIYIKFLIKVLTKVRVNKLILYGTKF